VRANGESGAASVVRVDSVTEWRNPRTVGIDGADTLGILRMLNHEDSLVATAVAEALPALARVVDVAVDRYRAGGNIYYFGAGTSGRIAAMDAAEIPPTFSVDPGRVVAHYAGGMAARDRAVESAEDDAGLGREAAAQVGAGDVAVGLAASGRTPYVQGALEAARDKGAHTVLVTSRSGGPIAPLVDECIFVDTGPEAIAGSTRLKAGTAQKMVLNGFSTALMVRLGKTFSNLMIDVAPRNAKLRGRVLSILEEVSGAPEEECARTLAEAHNDTRTALVMLLAGATPTEAREALGGSGGNVRSAIEALRGRRDTGGDGTNRTESGSSEPTNGT